MVAYVNKLGGTVFAKLNTIVRELWLWCMNWDITLLAEHLPGVLNTIADSQESQIMGDWSDWMLNPRISNNLQQKRGPLEVDMHVCIQTDNSAQEVFQLETRPRSRSAGCLQPELGKLTEEGPCQSCLESSRQNAQQSMTTAGHTGPSDSSMEEAAMVPHSTGHAGGLPNPPPIQGGPDHTNTLQWTELNHLYLSSEQKIDPPTSTTMTT